MRSLAAIAAITLVLVLAGGGHVLTRLDRMASEQRATSAQVRLQAARLELVRAIAQRDDKPANAPDEACGLALRRTEALRGALLALVRTGVASMPGDPGGKWVTWR